MCLGLTNHLVWFSVAVFRTLSCRIPCFMFFVVFVCFFFFSSRRRHTRFDCDWSSDVCSSDLLGNPKSAMRWSAAVALLWILFAAFFLDALFFALMDLPFILKCVVVTVMSAPDRKSVV